MTEVPPVTDFHYNFYESRPADLIYQGDASFPTDATYLSLTRTDSSGCPEQSSFGRVIYPYPVQFWKPEAQADFETTVKFTIQPKDENCIAADGLVFFIVPKDYIFPTPGLGGDLGVFGDEDRPHVFAVEFDIFDNEWDPGFPHVGINIKNRISRSVAQIPASFVGKEVTLKITYFAATHVISAIVTAGPQTVEASYECNLSHVLCEQVWVGLAGSTGAYDANHYVSFWSFHSALQRA